MILPITRCSVHAWTEVVQVYVQIFNADGLKCQFEGVGVSQLDEECRMCFMVSIISILRVM